MAKTALDAIDRKILKYLIKNARMPFLEIARECGISGAAIHQRIRKLDEAGVILGSRLIVDPKVMGFDVCAYISIMLKDPQLQARTVEELKKVNENLRVSLMALRDKPGRKEMQRLQVLQKAADRLTLNSPGFGPVWQAALKESEEEFQKVYSGFIPFIKRHIPRPTDAEVIDVQDNEGNS